LFLGVGFEDCFCGGFGFVFEVGVDEFEEAGAEDVVWVCEGEGSASS
jgi:hypothetical protein